MNDVVFGTSENSLRNVATLIKNLLGFSQNSSEVFPEAKCPHSVLISLKVKAGENL